MPAAYSDVTLYRRLLSQARPYWPHISVFFLVSLLSTPLILLAPVPLKIAVDSVIGSDPLPGFIDPLIPGVMKNTNTGVLLLAAILYVVISLLTQVQGFVRALLRTYTGEKLVLGFRARLFRHMQRLSLGYHDSQGTADSTYRIQYDATSIQSIAIDGVVPFISSAVTLGSMIYIIMLLDWQLGLVALAISPVLFGLASTYRQRLRSRSRDVKRLESSAMSVVQEVLSSVRVVKGFAQEDREQERFELRSSQGVRARLRLALAEGAFGLMVGIALAVGTASVLYIGTRHVQSGALTLGELLLVMAYLSQLYQPLKTASRKVGRLQSHLASAERAFGILDEAPDVPESPRARPISRAKGSIEFRDVSFGYSPETPVLERVSFAVAPGARVGIFGATGAGKTSLASLLTRFYDPQRGEILLDGVDLREYKLNDLRNQFAIVLQETILFSTTIAENIAYARLDASYEEVVAAARMARAHDFVCELPEGYDTLVGERGMRLSGGERQRISLARAFLKDAPILILDEPTSSVDMETEASIMEAMQQLMRDRTTFMIAHRLSTLDDCDVWIRIEDGQLREITWADKAARGETPALRALASAPWKRRDV